MQKNIYSNNDFSIIIVTYNRPNELERNFENMKKLLTFPREILVIDQSENDKTKKVCDKYKKSLKIIKYFHSNKPSIPMAKNIGVAKSSNKSKILIFLDDDAFIGKRYMDEIINYYNSLKDASGIFGYSYNNFHYSLPNTYYDKMKFRLQSLIKKFFFLGYEGDKYFRITSPYGNNCTFDIKSPVMAHWFPGTDPSYKREILKKIKFDENFFWWALGEDIDISYRIHKKFGNLYVVPASISHKHPLFEDNEEKKIKKIYMNQINHFYMYYKLMNNMKFRFLWNLLGIFFLRTISLLQFNKKRYVEWKFFIKSLAYSLRNSDKIKKGDLSIPYNNKA